MPWRSVTPGLVPKQTQCSLGLPCFALMTLEAVLQESFREGWPLPSHGCCTYTMALVLGTACPPATAVWQPWWSSWPDQRPASLPWFARQSGLIILSPAVIFRPPCPLMLVCCGTCKNSPTNPTPWSVWISLFSICTHYFFQNTCCHSRARSRWTWKGQIGYFSNRAEGRNINQPGSMLSGKIMKQPVQ